MPDNLIVCIHGCTEGFKCTLTLYIDTPGEERGPAHKLRADEFPAPAPADSAGSGGLAGMAEAGEADSDAEMPDAGDEDEDEEAEAGEETDESSDDVRPSLSLAFPFRCQRHASDRSFTPL